MKGNAGIIQDEVLQYFKEAEEAGYKYLEHRDFSEKDLGHNRIVSRTIRCVQDIERLPQAEEWEKLKSLIEVISKRESKEEMIIERCCYITC